MKTMIKRFTKKLLLGFIPLFLFSFLAGAAELTDNRILNRAFDSTNDRIKTIGTVEPITTVDYQTGTMVSGTKEVRFLDAPVSLVEISAAARGSLKIEIVDKNSGTLEVGFTTANRPVIKFPMFNYAISTGSLEIVLTNNTAYSMSVYTTVKGR